MTIFYTLGDKLFINLTNACPCNCLFCVRSKRDGVGSAESLWLEREPDLQEIKTAFSECGLCGITEIVFCGYGEPMERAGLVMEVCGYIRQQCALPLRINTNGLVKLIDPDFAVSKLAAVDSVSVSLNADNESEYLRLTRPGFGSAAWSAMLNFAREASAYTSVILTAVNVLPRQSLDRCKEIADSLGVEFRVRDMI
ncbi:MAG: TatD family nuclease-associated radical SAM protein [Oscillospiraceae bacterium]|nr:TatD family nuclease-associated radical SAM protein [Oscillospiraceae bacterium]